ncbi:MAG: hypothetical protein JNL83_22940 [Myxococcales bacterium]|nr:hypothetical protein [Myxococcales bacterium]
MSYVWQIMYRHGLVMTEEEFGIIRSRIEWRRTSEPLPKYRMSSAFAAPSTRLSREAGAASPCLHDMRVVAGSHARTEPRTSRRREHEPPVTGAGPVDGAISAPRHIDSIEAAATQVLGKRFRVFAHR